MPYKDKEQAREYARRYDRGWRRRNKDRLRATRRRFYVRHRTQILERHRKEDPGYYQRNRDRIKARAMRYYDTHREPRQKYAREHYAENRDEGTARVNWEKLNGENGEAYEETR